MHTAWTRSCCLRCISARSIIKLRTVNTLTNLVDIDPKIVPALRILKAYLKDLVSSQDTGMGGSHGAFASAATAAAVPLLFLLPLMLRRLPLLPLMLLWLPCAPAAVTLLAPPPPRCAVVANRALRSRELSSRSVAGGPADVRNTYVSEYRGET